MAKEVYFFEWGDRATKKLIWVVIGPERSWPPLNWEKKRRSRHSPAVVFRHLVALASAMDGSTTRAITLVRPGRPTKGVSKSTLFT
jgi:hypothetical protein